MPAGDHIDVFDTTMHKTYEWIHDLNDELGFENRRRSYDVLRAFLHALRDRLPVDEMAQLGAQMPMLLRGVYFEGWNPSHIPTKMKAGEFAEYFGQKARLTNPEEIKVALQASAGVLRKHVSAGEVNQVIDNLPKDIRRLLEGAPATEEPGNRFVMTDAETGMEWPSP